MWDDIAAWSGSAAGARILQTAVVPALAILVAGVVAALIGRAMARAVLARGDRDRAASAVAGLVESARLAAGGERDRAARLRTEADVRTRLLPLPGAALAADWAASRIDALRSDDSGPAGVAAVRDTLLAWTRSPRRAKRLFAEPTPARPTRAEQKAAAAPQKPAERPAAPLAAPAPAEESRPAVAESPAHRHAEAAVPAPPAPVAEPAPGRAPAPEVPAWQRTKAGEQLREQRTAAHAQADEDEAGLTAPVKPFAQRAEEPAPVAVAAPARVAEPARAEEPTRKQESPAWLDDYDDEAQVTQNLTLRTPPPVAATSVRDRRPTGSDIVPRG